MVVAIDGPAGAGKSTVAQRVARALGLTYIDTGAMYRAVAWSALQQEISTTDGEALGELARRTELMLSPLTESGRQQVRANGVVVTDAIRTPEVSSATSAVSAFPQVRRVVVEQQRRMGAQDARGVVLEGRDIGTVVFPDASLKVFLTASPGERARRRAAELRAQGRNVDDAAVLAEQNERDGRDSQRADSPLSIAPDAVVIETDGLDIEAVVAMILDLCKRLTGCAVHEW